MGEGEEFLNGMNVAELREYVRMVEVDPSEAERDPTILARWDGGSRAQLKYKDQTISIGGEGEPSAMVLLLASLAACDVEVVATTATLLGLKVEDLEVEAKGHFNIQRLLGLEQGPEPGYDRIGYTVRVKAPGASDEQIAQLTEMCERSSPVGDTLTRRVPLTLEVEADE